MKMSEFQRQHPLMIPYKAGKQFFGIILPIILISLLTGLREGEFSIGWTHLLGVLGVFCLFLFYNFLEWFFFYYRVVDGILHIRSGILIKNERYIRPERIQAINTRAGIFLRLFNLLTLTVETAGGSGEAELNITALPAEEAESLEKKLAITSENMAPVEPQTCTENAFSLSPRDILISGLTSGNFLLLFSIFGVILSQAYPIIPDWFWDFVFLFVSERGPVIVGFLILILLLLSWLISSIKEIVQLGRFSVYRSGDEIKIAWGLIEKKSMSLEAHRVQAISLEEGILRLPWRLRAVKPEIVGRATEGGEEASVLYPLLRPEDTPEFIQSILPEFAWREKQKSLPQRARIRYIFRTTILFFLLSLILSLIPFFQPYGLLTLILIPPALYYGHIRFKETGWAIEDNYIFIQNRLLARRTSIITYSNIQDLRLTINPLQRRKRLATLQVGVASSPDARIFKLKDIDQEIARQFWYWFSRSRS